MADGFGSFNEHPGGDDLLGGSSSGRVMLRQSAPLGGFAVQHYTESAADTCLGSTSPQAFCKCVTDTAGERLNDAADLIPGLGRINLNLTELTDACGIFCELINCVPSISSVRMLRSSQPPFDPSAPAPPLAPTGPFSLTSSTPYLTTDYNAPTNLVPDARLASFLRKFVAGQGLGAFGIIHRVRLLQLIVGCIC